MNILYLCADRGIPIRGHKGAAVHVRALANAFAQAGHTVTILTPRPGPEDGPTPQATIVECERPDRFLEPVRSADVIYERYSLWSEAGARLRAATGRPFVLEVNAPLRLEAARHRHLENDALAAQIEATQFAAADFLAVVSEPLADYVVAQGANPAHVHVLPNGVDPQQFHPAVRGGAVREKYGLHGRIIVGFAGRMRPWHDGPTLLRAFARLYAADPAYHLLLVGEMSPEVEMGIVEMGLVTAVTTTGPVPHAEIPTHLSAMDIAVSSHAPASDEDFYFSPLKLFEYLACGVPTVAANVGQPGRLIRPGHNGYLYPPGDDAALAAAIQQVVDHPAHARELAWNGAEMVLQKYTWGQNAARVLDWLAQRMAAAPAARQPETADQGAGVPLPILDAKLRQRLYRATSPDLAAPLLARRLAASGNTDPYWLERIEAINVLKYKPGRRCVLAYELVGHHKQSGQPMRQTVIGKVFRDERGARLLVWQQALYQGGFGPDAADGIYVPQPLVYVPEMRMLVQASAPGETLDALTRRGHTPLPIHRAAQGLAKLHQTELTLFGGGAQDGYHRLPDTHHASRITHHLSPYTLAHERRALDDYTARLAEVRPEDMPAIEALRTGLLGWAERLPLAATAVPLHRDFYYSQLLFDGPRLHLIDFDLLAWGDPAIDVANFTAHLTYLGLEQFHDLHRFDREIADFLELYMAACPLDFTLLERVAFYQAATFYRLLNVIAPRPAVCHLFPALLAHTQHQLDLQMASIFEIEPI